MRSFRWLKVVSLALGLFALAPSTFAYIQYTYTSDPLIWRTSYLDRQQTDYQLNVFDLMKFEFSFEVDEKALSKTEPTMLLIKDFKLTPTRDALEGSTGFEYDYKMRGRVEINPDKSINYWYILFDVNADALGYSDEFNSATNHRMTINSFGGANTCNCDLFQDRFNSLTDDLGFASLMESRFGNRSSFDNWTLSYHVPEGNSLALVAIGLLGLVAIRRGKANNLK